MSESLTVGSRSAATTRRTHLIALLGQFWSVARWLLVLVPMVQIALLLWLIWNHTLDVPVNDEWSTADLVWRADHGVLRWTDFWALWNEHRIVIPRLIDLTLIKLTHWNPQIEMTFDVGIAIATVLLLFRCVRRTFGSMNGVLALVLPFSLLFFSFSQLEDWLAPFQVQFFMTMFGVVLCMWALTNLRTGPGAFIVALLGAMIASLSGANGLFAWVAFLPVLWLVGYRTVRSFAIWIAAALAVIIPYFIGFPPQSHKISVSASFHYALIFLGSPVGFPDISRSQLFGAISIVLMAVNLLIYWLQRRDLRLIAGWLGLALFALASMASGAVVRAPVYGVAEAVSSRYDMFSCVWWLTLVVITGLNLSRSIAVMRDRPHSGVRFAWGGFIAVNLVALPLLCVFLVQTNRTSFAVSRIVYNERKANEGCVVNYRVASDNCLRLFYPEPQVVRTLAANLDQHHLSIFRKSNTLTPTTQKTRYSIDTVGDVTVALPHQEPIAILQGTQMKVRGWAVDIVAQRPAGGVLVVLDGTQRIRSEYGDNRDDVAKALGNAIYRGSGFSTAIDTAQLPPGPHSLTIAVITSDGKQFYQAPETVMLNVVQRSFDQMTKLSGGTLSSIDAVYSKTTGEIIVARPYQGPILIPRTDPIAISGWAVDTVAHTGVGSVFLTIDGTTDVPTTYGLDRIDVSSVLGDDAYLPSGYTVIIPAKTLTPGKHILTIKVVPKDLRGYAESSQSVEIEVQQ